MATDLLIDDNLITADGPLRADNLTSAFITGNFVGKPQLLIVADNLEMVSQSKDSTGEKVSGTLFRIDPNNHTVVINDGSRFKGGVRVAGSLTVDGRGGNTLDVGMLLSLIGRVAELEKKTGGRPSEAWAVTGSRLIRNFPHCILGSLGRLLAEPFARSTFDGNWIGCGSPKER
jgi:hypothetical protein